MKTFNQFMQESQLGGPLPYRNLPKKLPSKYSTPIITSQETGTGYSANMKKGAYPKPGEDPIRWTLDTVKDYKRKDKQKEVKTKHTNCLLYTSPSPRDRQKSRMPSSA